MCVFTDACEKRHRGFIPEMPFLGKNIRFLQQSDHTNFRPFYCGLCRFVLKLSVGATGPIDGLVAQRDVWKEQK